MKLYTDYNFQTHLNKLINEVNTDLAIQIITGAIRAAEQQNDEEEACYFYSSLAGIYFTQEKITEAITILEECENNFPNSIQAKYMLLENFFWHLRNHEKVIEKTDSIVELIEFYMAFYHKALYLKGLSLVELGKLDEALEMLRITEYYDLALVEKLLAHRIGLTDCKKFLLSALDKNKYFKARGENVEAKIMKIEKLLYNLEETL